MTHISDVNRMSVDGLDDVRGSIGSVADDVSLARSVLRRLRNDVFLLLEESHLPFHN